MREHVKEGAARQAIVVADLLRKGFEVWQEIGNSSVDLIAGKYGYLLRVEVKGPREKGRVPTGVISRVAEHNNHAVCTRFDLLATVDGNQIHYNRSAMHVFNVSSKELVGTESYSKHTTKSIRAKAERMLEEQC